jgi:hypothetical protein
MNDEMVGLYLNGRPDELPRMPCRRKAFAPCLEQCAAGRTEPAILQHLALQVLPAWLGRQKTATERSVGMAIEFELPQGQMQAILAAGEQVELLVRHDESVGVEGPG